MSEALSHAKVLIRIHGMLSKYWNIPWNWQSTTSTHRIYRSENIGDNSLDWKRCSQFLKRCGSKVTPQTNYRLDNMKKWGQLFHSPKGISFLDKDGLQFGGPSLILHFFFFKVSLKPVRHNRRSGSPLCAFSIESGGLFSCLYDFAAYILLSSSSIQTNH